MFTVFLIECVDYPLLFKEQSHETNIFFILNLAFMYVRTFCAVWMLPVSEF
jgi:hypothetical protein